MKTNYLFLILLILSIAACSTFESPKLYQKLSITPKPVELERTNTPFSLDKNTSIDFDDNIPELAIAAGYFNKFLKDQYHFQLPVNKKSDTTIRLVLKKISDKQEEYQLIVNSDSIVITANQTQGILHGLESLKQIIYPSQELSNGKIEIPGVKITDYPAYSWRGMHLDVCRHFFPKEEILQLLDAMAAAKLNIFHWHLTDDQGWRIEIKKYPKLTQIGAFRDSTIIGHMADNPKKYKVERYGEYYTQEDIKEVVQYAGNLGITVVPEIEMPGHAVAALRAYPQYSCNGKHVDDFSEWGVSDDVYCAGNEKTFAFLQDILSEVIDLFPSPYIHIGGDECPKTKWKTCPKCQAKMRLLHLDNEMELQSYFIKRIEKFVRSKGKRLVGWNEILEGGLAEGAMVMSWQGEKGGIVAAKQGHDVIMTPNAKVYLDHYQSKYYEPLAIAGLTTPEEIYNWSPMPKELDAKYKKFILGAQANVWTEYIPNNDHLEYMIFPRLIALSEILWTGKDRKDFADFTSRMNEMYARLDAMHIHYRIPYPENLLPYKIFTKQKIELPLTNGIPSSTILYTLNGENPLEKGEKYTKPLLLNLKQDVELKAVSVMPSGRHSAVITSSLRYRKPEKAIRTNHVKAGLTYHLYKGEFSSAEKLTGKHTTGVIESLMIPKETPEHFFGLQYEGLIEVPEDGMYQFRLTADDGATLYIHNKLVITRDGFSYGSDAVGYALLKKGLHPIRINYFQAKYGKELRLEASLNENQTPILLHYFHKAQN
ncbi:family 20 glycosylhydrolase [Ancylomarina longa]|uniref:beta-N-acetylhexosaminidase n=1 Tax=Ancylomarina longa TaxID=2487017 RepID=A0A434AXI5_9BACT|nr:family 20 glycosylhydrolase [Ancylomarina longa]RUT79203.1 beta-N-acetylhexosaminidase [Ancylomarina longa]